MSSASLDRAGLGWCGPGHSALGIDVMVRSSLVVLVAGGLFAAASGCTVGRVEEDAGGVDAPFRIDVDAGHVDAHTGCAPGEIDCGGTCTRVVGDSLHCGSCGNACPSGVTCAIGRCDCYAPMLGCDGVCLDPREDPLNCGTCGKTCSAAEVCSGGECVIDCDPPNALCTTTGTDGPVQACIDVQSDPMNCGACNTRCAGGATCQAGRCACPTGQMNCSGTCTDVSTDANNCGACLTSCGADGVCTSGTCSSCGTGLTACGTPSRCVDTGTSRLHCGSCGRACGPGEACAGGLCQCTAGLVDCGAGCTNPMTDVENCGGCGIDCGPGGVCSAGVCTCATGLMMCGASCHDLGTDLAHCGACDAACPALVGGVCAGGTCGCPAGLTDCSGSCRNTMNDRDNCGTCGMACPVGNVCLMGACTDAPPTRYEQITPPAGTVSFIDACAVAGHTEVLAGQDDSSTRVPLPFPFRYWATDLAAGAMINVVTNGWIGMDGVASSSLGGSVPSTSSPNAVIAPHWGDNYTRGPICIATVGTAPYRQLVVEWNDEHYCCTDDATHLTYEVILSESSGTIDLVYGTIAAARSQTMGIENQTGAMGINACPGGTGTCAPTTGQIVRFNPIP